MQRLVSCRVCCCKKNRKQIILHKSLKKLQKEVDVIKLIRSKRFVHLALKHLLDNTVRKELKAKSRFKEVKIEEQKPDNPLA